MGNRPSVVLAEGNFHDKYALGRKLGQGTFGQVRACNVRVGESEKFVVKIVDVRVDKGPKKDGDETKPQDLVLDPRKVADIRNEYVMMSRRMGLSIYCVASVEMFAAQGMYYLVMERCECSLIDKLEEMGGWNPDQMRRIFREMLLGVEYVHSRSIVHRDIKPDNFLHGLDDIVKLTDFGLAIVVPKAKTFFSNVRASPSVRGEAGTVPYMSPEMLRGEKYDLKTDTWSYGVSVYFLLYGELPYGALVRAKSSMKESIMYGDRPSYRPQEKVGDVSTDGSSIQQIAKGYIECLLDRSPKTRWSSKQALGAQFFSVGPKLLWSASDTTSSIDLQGMIGMARCYTKDFDDKNNLEVTVDTDLDVHLSKLQQDHGGLNVDLRRAFSLPLPPKTKTGTYLETLAEEDEAPMATIYSSAMEGVLTRASSAGPTYSGDRREQSKDAVDLKPLGFKDGVDSTSAAKPDGNEALLQDFDKLLATTSTAAKDDWSEWSEGTWSDESTECGDPPPPLPRLPPCHAAVAAVAKGRPRR